MVSGVAVRADSAFVSMRRIQGPDATRSIQAWVVAFRPVDVMLQVLADAELSLRIDRVWAFRGARMKMRLAMPNVLLSKLEKDTAQTASRG